MKIFPPPQSSTVGNTVKSDRPKGKSPKNGPVRIKAPVPEKKNLSAEDIKEKLASHVETSGAAKKMAVKNTQKLGEGFLNDAIVRPPVIVPFEEKVSATDLEGAPEEAAVKKDLLLKSDIALNDPKDSNTQEKLKSVLTKGAFNFNPKEKELLEKILA